MRKFNGRKALVGGSIAVVTGSLVAFVATWEGARYTPYKDLVGIWTVCAGVTGKHVVPGKIYSREECDALTGGAIERHGRELLDCIQRPVTQAQYEALASWAYNIGTGGACSSRLIRLLNAGEPPSVWCEELMRWNRAGGQEVKGLTRRRQAERDLCLG